MLGNSKKKFHLLKVTSLLRVFRASSKHSTNTRLIKSDSSDWHCFFFTWTFKSSFRRNFQNIALPLTDSICKTFFSPLLGTRQAGPRAVSCHFSRFLLRYKVSFVRSALFCENYSAHSGNSLPTFRDNISVLFSRVKNPSVPKRRQRITTIRCVITQKSADLIY
jgi:hypothetical protein